MTTFLLIRHAAHDFLGRVLVGRAPGVHLNEEGKKESKRLADRLSTRRVKAVYSGPLERAQETAAEVSQKFSLSTLILPAFDELNFGEWTSLTFGQLQERPDWRAWNQARDSVVPPQGESIRQVQERAASSLQHLAELHPEEEVAVVSHGEVIRSAVMFYLGMPVDFHSRLEISPASISIIRLHQGQPQVLAVNHLDFL